MDGGASHIRCCRRFSDSFGRSGLRKPRVPERAEHLQSVRSVGASWHHGRGHDLCHSDSGIRSLGGFRLCALRGRCGGVGKGGRGARAGFLGGGRRRAYGWALERISHHRIEYQSFHRHAWHGVRSRGTTPRHNRQSVYSRGGPRLRRLWGPVLGAVFHLPGCCL